MEAMLLAMYKLDEAIDAADAWLELVRKQRKRLKGLPRVGFNPCGGNVEHNIEMFNKMNSPVSGVSNNPVSGPFGGDVSAPASSGMAEDLSIYEYLNTLDEELDDKEFDEEN